jgi:hypothetical protein
MNRTPKKVGKVKGGSSRSRNVESASGNAAFNLWVESLSTRPKIEAHRMFSSFKRTQSEGEPKFSGSEERALDP